MVLAEFAPVVPLMLLAVGVGTLVVFLSRLLGPFNPNTRKIAHYESGMRPIGQAMRRIPVKFYRVGMLFILFDIEVIFFLPWAVVFRDLGFFGLAVMGLFVLILTVGLIYEWKKGALEWE